MNKKLSPATLSLALCSFFSLPLMASEVGSLPGSNDGKYIINGGYYLMRSEWTGIDSVEGNNLINDIERDAPFVKFGYEFADDWYASVNVGYERIANNVSGENASKLNTDRELFAGFDIKGIAYRNGKISVGPFFQYNAYTDFSVAGSIFSNGLIDIADIEVSDIYTTSAGVMAQYQFEKLAVYGGAYYIKSEASAKGAYGATAVDLVLEDDNASRLLLGVNFPLAEDVSLDFETHIYNDFSFAITVNYYPFKEKQIKKGVSSTAELVSDTPSIKDAAPTEFENQIYFASGSVEVGESEYPKIRALARFLLKRPGSDVIIEGHCDCFGEEEFNQELSEKRALAVKKMLINFYNIPEDRILVVGYGESFPAASNTTKEGRSKNRRVRVYAIE